MSRLRVGDKPNSGHTVELRRQSFGAALPTVVEWFIADGTWTCPQTTNGHYYYDLGSEAAQRDRVRREYGVG